MGTRQRQLERTAGVQTVRVPLWDVRVAHLCAAALIASATVAVSASAQSARLNWVPNPRVTSGSWVSDPARHLDRATVARVDSIISALERESSVEIAVVVLDSLDRLAPADAALLLHRRWGVGKRQRDNGIVFLWSPALRKTYVSVGYGLEGVLPDAVAGRIQDEVTIPAFRRGDFASGVVGTVRALASVARGEAYAGLERVRIGEESGLIMTWGRLFGSVALKVAALIGLAMGLLSLMSFGVAQSLRLVGRKCPRGHRRMRRLSETDEDALLSKEQAFEETIGSRDFDVYVCRRCDAKVVLPIRRAKSKHVTCPECRRMTCFEIKSVLVKATTQRADAQVVRRHCELCGFKQSGRVAIPQLDPWPTRVAWAMSNFASAARSSLNLGRSGRSDGGSSGFGGGSAGGGGAGRSY